MDGIQKVGFAGAIGADKTVDVRRESNVRFFVILKKEHLQIFERH